MQRPAMTSTSNERTTSAPYPISGFVSSLPAGGQAAQPEHRGYLFLAEAGRVLGIHLLLPQSAWFPNVLFGKIPLELDFSSLAAVGHLPEGGEPLWKFTLYFGDRGDVFLPKEVSLSLGIGPFIWIFIARISRRGVG